MAKQILIAALDIGGGKITAVAAAVNNQKNFVKIVAGKDFICEGLAGGTVTDISETTATVSEAIAYLEEAAQTQIGALYLALRGEHIESFTNKGSLNIARMDREITPEDIEQLIANAKSIQIKSNTEILSVVPQGFYVDRQLVKNPEGMDATSLEVDVHITTGLSSTFNNLNKAVERAECSVTGRFYGLICLADAVLPQEAKNMGALLIDMGKDNTSAGIYADGALLCSYDIELGSDLITSDIAKILRITHKEAEEIKLKYGTAFPDNYEEETEIVISPIGSKTENRINRDYLLEIIRPRVQDIFEAVKERMQGSGFYELANVAVLTGGGSLLPGVQEQARTTLDIKEVMCASVQKDLVECDKEFLDPKFATAVSLAYFVAKREILDTGSRKNTRKGNFFANIFRTLKNSDFFGG